MNKFFLNLGSQPLANNYLNKYNSKQIKYYLRLYFNTKTKLVSISKRIPSERMFNNSYPYKSSMSKTMRKSFYKLSILIKKKFNPRILLEIGSNDGALLSNFNKKRVIGVEPCSNLAKITKKKGYKIFNNYWNTQLAKKIKNRYNNIDLIYSANTLTHISDLDNVFHSIKNVLSDNGILIIEDPSLLECIKKTSYDQFYNEHIYVFSALSVKNLLKKFQLEIFNIENLNTHGGSLRYFIKKTKNKNIKINNSVKKQLDNEIKFDLHKLISYKKFAKSTIESKKKLIKMFSKLKSKKKKIIGYGATAKATTILNYCNLDEKFLEFFVDTTPDKANKYMPGKNIKIFKYHKSLFKNIDYVFLGAWNFKKEIFNKEKKLINSGVKFITHVPTPRIINK